jgi:hypothetical protein
VGIAGSIAAVTLFTNRFHHVTAWQSPFQGVFLAAMDHPEARTLWNGPQHAWEHVGGKTHWDASHIAPTIWSDVQSASCDSASASVAIARAVNSDYLSPDADALLWCHRPLLEQRNWYNGDYRRYGLLRPDSVLPPGMVAASTARPDSEFPLTAAGSLAELMAASGVEGEPTPCREVYAGLALVEPLPVDAELVLTCTLDGGQIFYRSVPAARAGGGWLAVGLRVADLALTPNECQRVRLTAYLWNPLHQRVETGPLVLGAARGNRFQYAWSQSVPAP